MPNRDLVHHSVGAAANVHDPHAVDDSLRGGEKHAFADSRYRGVEYWTRR
jgi:IS5 family transposase